MRHGGVRRRRDAIRENRESGVSAIEFVFLTPVLFFLIYFVLALGRDEA